jgi:hypothetical protein
MKHEQENIKTSQTLGDQCREAAAFRQVFARSAVHTAAHVAAFVSVYKPVYEAIQRDAERIGEETRKSISIIALSIAAMNLSNLAGMRRDFVAQAMRDMAALRRWRESAFFSEAAGVTSHLERIN